MNTHQGKGLAVVTGGAGFIGSHLTDTLLKAGYGVRVVDNFAAPRREERVNKEAELIEADVRDTEKMKDVCRGARFVFHLAALPRVQDSIDRPLETHDVNVTGTLSVLIAAHVGGVEKFLCASSAAVYGNQTHLPIREDVPLAPESPYGLHKQMTEEYLALFAKLFSLPSVALRLFNVYGARFDPSGPYALVVGKFLEAKKAGTAATLFGDGSHTRDYVHVHDVARAFLRAAEHATPGVQADIYNIGTGVETSVATLAEMLGCEIERAPERIELARSRADISRATKELDWVPEIPITKGLSDLAASYLS